MEGLHKKHLQRAATWRLLDEAPVSITRSFYPIRERHKTEAMAITSVLPHHWSELAAGQEKSHCSGAVQDGFP